MAGWVPVTSLVEALVLRETNHCPGAQKRCGGPAQQACSELPPWLGPPSRHSFFKVRLQGALLPVSPPIWVWHISKKCSVTMLTIVYLDIFQDQVSSKTTIFKSYFHLQELLRPPQ